MAIVECANWPSSILLFAKEAFGCRGRIYEIRAGGIDPSYSQLVDLCPTTGAETESNLTEQCQIRLILGSPLIVRPHPMFRSGAERPIGKLRSAITREGHRVGGGIRCGHTQIDVPDRRWRVIDICLEGQCAPTGRDETHTIDLSPISEGVREGVPIHGNGKVIVLLQHDWNCFGEGAVRGHRPVHCQQLRWSLVGMRDLKSPSAVCVHAQVKTARVVRLHFGHAAYLRRPWAIVALRAPGSAQTDALRGVRGVVCELQRRTSRP